jgi:tRNA modification GTPase
MSFPSDTIAALATPVGTSAIAVIRASGPRTGELVRAIFRKDPLPRTACHADYHDCGNNIVDDVLFTFFAGPNSFTGEDTLEISCHGNPFIAQKVLLDLLARGCHPAEAGEFSKRAFLNGRLDLSQAEAVMDLIQARSDRALAAANQQLRGALGRHVEALITQLLSVLAMIEAYIDFPEEDLPDEDRSTVLRNIHDLIAGTNRLIATGSYGVLLRQGIRTVILGEPNAGKSSLLNQLVGRERALVSPEPGTTRDYLEEQMMVGAHSLQLIDTAGLNPTPAPIEKCGIEKTFEQVSKADLILWVIDSTRPMPTLDPTLAGHLRAGNTIVVFNKVDLTAALPTTPPHDFPFVRVSALQGTGMVELLSAISHRADSFQVTVGDEVIAINARHEQALRQAALNLEAASEKLNGNEYNELVSSDLRSSLGAFGQIAGKIDNERMLDALFSSFCIGK